MQETSINIKEPGLNTLPPGVERYTVNGGGLTGIQILPDDEIEIINNEGNQICEISVFNKDGKSETGILNLKENKDASGIKKILLAKDENSKIAAHQLKKRNLNIEKSKSSIIFDKDTNWGEKIKLKSKDKCYCIFAAPGEVMLIKTLHDKEKKNPLQHYTEFVLKNSHQGLLNGYKMAIPLVWDVILHFFPEKDA